MNRCNDTTGPHARKPEEAVNMPPPNEVDPVVFMVIVLVMVHLWSVAMLWNS